MKTSLLAVLASVVFLGACTQQQLEQCDLSRSPMCMAMVGCVPQCDGRQCGDDGCGGVCGTCEQFSLCSADGQCEVCDQSQLCLDKQCGPDGCGRLCGLCPDDSFCQDGACVQACVPDCIGKGCGPDGCGGTCGQCIEDFECNGAGQCAPGPLAADCRPRAEGGCPNCAEGVEECVCGIRPECCTEEWEPRCGYYAVYYCGGFCGERFEGCDGDVTDQTPFSRQCGVDEVGNSCGTCSAGQACHGGASCVAVSEQVFGHHCKTDQECLGGVCLADRRICSAACFNTPDCPEGWFCRHSDANSLFGSCEPMSPCWPSCDGRQCGPDGCGGFCGECEDGQACSALGLCEVPSDGCEEKPGVPGTEGLCRDPVCETDPACCELGWDLLCIERCGMNSGDCGEIKTCEEGSCDGCSVANVRGCFGCECQDCVCAKYPHCCLEGWDRTCVEACRECGGNCK
jgi:hypothetical protein